jgi:hypothetical protein
MLTSSRYGSIEREAGIEMTYGTFNLEWNLSKLQLSERWQYVVPVKRSCWVWKNKFYGFRTLLWILPKLLLSERWKYVVSVLNNFGEVLNPTYGTFNLGEICRNYICPIVGSM